MQVKLIILSVLCFLCGTVSYADQDAARLQKLFTDKQQRAQIDAARKGNKLAPARKKTKKVKVQGYVTRTGGKSVAWVNNKNTLENSRVGNVKVQQSNIGKYKKVGVTVDGTHIHLKPGESWSKSAGVSDITK